MSKLKLYFLDQELEGKLLLTSPLDFVDCGASYESHLWFCTRFTTCRDAIASEDSRILRAYFLKLLCIFHNKETEMVRALRHNDEVKGRAELAVLIHEVETIIRIATNYPTAIWIYGGDDAKEVLQERLAGLPSRAEHQAFLGLDHMHRLYRRDLETESMENEAEIEYRNLPHHKQNILRQYP